MTTEQKIEKLMAAHYRIMARPRFWYEPQWKDASKRLCVMASNLRVELRKAT